MSSFFILLAFVALIGLVVGLIKPKMVKMETRKKVLLWFGGAFVILIIMGGATAPATPATPASQSAPVVPSNPAPANNSPAAPISTGSPEAIQTPTPITPAPTTPVPVPVPVPAPTPTPTWQKVISIKTEADKQSETFSLAGGQQKLIYKATGSYVMCLVYLFPENQTLAKDGGFPVITIEKAMSGETMMRNDAGNYYLDIKDANGNPCNVEIQELK